MSPICQTFVQNSWKNDLCSNCFRSKDDHESLGKSNVNYPAGSTGPRRYVGVAGRSAYPRTFYGHSWTSILDRDSDYLKSPGLIKGMDNLIKESEKNQLRMEKHNDVKSDDYNKVNLQTTKNVWLLSNYNTTPPNTRDSLQKDDSADLGSDAGSHDTSTSSSIDSASLDYESPTKIEADLQDDVDSIISKKSNGVLPITTVQSILRSYSHSSRKIRSISFNSDDEVIGYGGDVDYSDDDGSFIDNDDDDDDISINSCDLSPDERILRRLTEKNTDFNTENLLEVVSRSDICSEDNSSTKEFRNQECKPETKVKLKRSQPHVTVKPNIKSQLCVNDESSCKGVDALDMLLKGIQPKFVPMQNEMIEKYTSNDSDESISSKKTTTKVTSIDDLIREASVTQAERKLDKKKEPNTQYSAYPAIKLDEVDVAKQTSEMIQRPKRHITPVGKENHSTCIVDKDIKKVTINCSKSIDKVEEFTTPTNSLDQNKQVLPQNLIQRRSSFMESQLGLDQAEVTTCTSPKTVNAVVPKLQPTAPKSEDIAVNKYSEKINIDPKPVITNAYKPPVTTIPSSLAKPVVAVVINSLPDKQSVTEDCSRNTAEIANTVVKNTTDNFSTFGPKLRSQSEPQSSFLHSGFLKGNGKLCSTTEFLQQISSPSDAITQTAGIQKSALHNSTSVKSLLNGKPFISLKALNPKEKPQVPPKTGIKYNGSRPVSAPVVNNLGVINGGDSWNKSTEIIYAVPTLTPICAISPISSSSGYSTTSNVSLLSKDGNETTPDNSTTEVVVEKKITDPIIMPPLPNLIDQKEDQTFPVTKENLDSSSQQSYLQTFKRTAPQPPFEDVSLHDYQPPPDIKAVPEFQQNLRYQVPQTHLRTTISDSPDFDSYSSFTDDFDDDDEDYPQQIIEASKAVNRSSSVTPNYRNSLSAMDSQHNTVSYKPADSTTGFVGEPPKYPATRSHSVPRSVESSVKVVQLDKKKSESSRFGFVKATFFRTSSPPSMKRKISFGRSRDRSKKSTSGFSFKKLLRIGSSDKSKQNKNKKDQEKQAEREIKKQKLQIVHPLDYNTTGVEVIARPEKTSPIGNVAEMYSPSIPNSVIPITTDIIDNVQKNDSKTTVSQECSSPKLELPERNSFGSNSAPMEPMSLSSLQFEISEGDLEKKSSFLKKKSKPERRNSAKLPPTGLTERTITKAQISNSKLGCNSEGRPKPPPPPRKTSLEASSDSSSHGEDRNSELSSRHSSDSESSLRRQLPSKRVAASLNPLALKPSLYANLGDVRAPFTPRKPFRSSSIKDIEKEKRKAPLPPRHSSKSKLLNGIDTKNHTSKSIAPNAPTILHSSNDSHSPTDSSSDVEKTKTQTSRTSSLPNLSDIKAEVLAHSNFESLSNLLDEVSNAHHSKAINPALSNISSWKDMDLVTSDPFFCGPRVFYDGKASGLKVVVMFSPENKMEVDPLVMPVPLHTFKEEVPIKLFGAHQVSGKNHINASIWILPNMSLSSLEEFSHFSQRLLERDPQKWEKRICLLLLQLVTALKHLQAKGIEETSLRRILVSDIDDGGDRNISSRLMLVSPSAEHSDRVEDGVSLCQCAAAVTLLLLGNGVAAVCSSARCGPVLSPPFAPRPHAFVAFVAMLREERANSLTKAKCILEAMLYGPLDVKQFIDNASDQLGQSWLDNERMNLLAHIGSSVDKCLQLVTKFHLFFLVRATTKSLRESILSLEPPDVTNF